MTPEEAQRVRVGETLISTSMNPYLWNHVRSGFRVTSVLPNGLQLRRVHAHYLTDQPIETWVARWDQLANSKLLPESSQTPLL